MTSCFAVADEAKKEVEVIEVYGYKHLTLFKKEWEQKRFEFMDFFNANIDNPDLKFDCRKKDARNSRIKEQFAKMRMIGVLAKNNLTRI
ncbi:hypothetical protein EYS14_21105 [Alteromonadaceae bacterium M269]|nr:hypothetical protein EYS14_21105 [Alteromonadaceae bacterium M269]